METKHTSLALLVLLAMSMVSCDTTVTPLKGKAKQDDKGIFSINAVVGTSKGDYLVDVRVLEVSYDPLLSSTIFDCVLLGIVTDNAKTIRVRPSNCYSTLKVVNPNDTITIWVHPCPDCVDGTKYLYPPCYVE